LHSHFNEKERNEKKGDGKKMTEKVIIHLCTLHQDFVLGVFGEANLPKFVVAWWLYLASAGRPDNPKIRLITVFQKEVL
jgi:hypothetical protein